MLGASPSHAKRDYITSESVAARALSTKMGGYVTLQLCEVAEEQFRKGVREGGRKTWIIDVSDVTGFDARAMRVGSRWYEAYKEAGGERIICVSMNPAARMAGRALGFGAGLGVDCVATMADALRSLGITPPVGAGKR